MEPFKSLDHLNVTKFDWRLRIVVSHCVEIRLRYKMDNSPDFSWNIYMLCVIGYLSKYIMA